MTMVASRFNGWDMDAEGMRAFRYAILLQKPKRYG